MYQRKKEYKRIAGNITTSNPLVVTLVGLGGGGVNYCCDWFCGLYELVVKSTALLLMMDNQRLGDESTIAYNLGTAKISLEVRCKKC